MAEYGLTPQGPNIKRLDVILEDMHKKLSEKWGVNTQQHPESLINHLLTNIADAIADLWEFGEHVYYAMYPYSAEGISLDNAAQYGGSTREAAAKSYYLMHCTGIDGTTLSPGTMLSSTTNPVTYLLLNEERKISRDSCNSAVIRVAAVAANNVYTIAIDGTLYSTTSTGASTALTILNALRTAINSDEEAVFAADEVDEDALTLNIYDKDSLSASHKIILTENLTTETVTSTIYFGTEEIGDIYLPNGVITNITRAEVGLRSVINQCGYIAGRQVETDEELRRSYADKIFNRSSMMLESIRSSILQKVQGITSIAAYENNTNSLMLEGAILTINEENLPDPGGIAGWEYVLTINEDEDISYESSIDDDEEDVLNGIATAIQYHGYSTSVDLDNHAILVEFSSVAPSNQIIPSHLLNVEPIGRPPHSIEVVVEGGDDTEIAKQIFDKKAAGIQTYGKVEITLPGDFDEDIVIRFNRPEKIYVWFRIAITVLPGFSLPLNYVDLLKNAIIENMDKLDAGDEVIPQLFVADLYAACPGIGHLEIKMYHTSDKNASDPLNYTETYVSISERQRAVTQSTKIKVVLNGS